MGIVNLSDQSGHFEAIVFSEGLQQYRDVLEPGSAVVLVLQAGLEGDEVQARIAPPNVSTTRSPSTRRACASSCATSARSAACRNV